MCCDSQVDGESPSNCLHRTIKPNHFLIRPSEGLLDELRKTIDALKSLKEELSRDLSRSSVEVQLKFKSFEFKV